jgi:Protein of unknown function (DUF2637)
MTLNLSPEREEIESFMADFRPARPSHAEDYSSRFRVTAVVTVITGVVLLSIAAFLLSYRPIREIALASGASPGLAALYPLMLDAMLVVACAATLALREAVWWIRSYAGLSFFVLLVLVALGDATHAARISLSYRAMAAITAVIPWVLVLVGFGLCLVILRHLRGSATGTPQFHRGPESGLPDSADSAEPREGQLVSGEAQHSAAGFPFWDGEPESRYGESASGTAPDDTPDVRIIPAKHEPDHPDIKPGTSG